MGRSPCCDDTSGLKKGPWTPEEDEKLTTYIKKHSHGSWRSLPKAAGLNRCGKSCRLRWTNYLRPDIKRGRFSEEEEDLIIKLHSVLGNKWSRIAARLSGRTDNEIKNHWNTHLRKKLLQMGIDPITHKPRIELNFLANLTHLFSNNPIPPNLGPNFMNHNENIINNGVGLQTNIAELAKLEVLSNIFQILNSSNQTLPNMDQPAAPFSYLNGLGSLNPNNNISNTGSNLYINNIDFTQEKLKSGPNWSNNNSLPSLASSPEAKNSINGGSGLMPSEDHFFKDWENLLDDTNGDSFWKEFINC